LKKQSKLKNSPKLKKTKGHEDFSENDLNLKMERKNSSYSTIF